MFIKRCTHAENQLFQLLTNSQLTRVSLCCSATYTTIDISIACTLMLTQTSVFFYGNKYSAIHYEMTITVNNNVAEVNHEGRSIPQQHLSVLMLHTSLYKPVTNLLFLVSAQS